MTPPTWSEQLQAAYAAHRARWRAEVDVHLERRELPGWPLHPAHAEVLARLGWPA